MTVRTASNEKTGGNAGFRLNRVQRRQLALLTLGALILFLVVRALPIGTNLNHVDFRVTGKNAIELCDSSNPAFISVVDVRSPVTLKLGTSEPPAQGRPAKFVLSMATLSGKPITPVDLAINHTRKLHLLVVDPSLGDYQHVHPVPGSTPGTWEFELTPHRRGLYRVFADFIPVATGRGLYAHADFVVPGATGAPIDVEGTTEIDGYVYGFILRGGELRAGKTAELDLQIRASAAGERVPLEPVMGAYAHVVAFDLERRGFAHLHPMAEDPLAAPDAVNPKLAFQVTIPQPGRYVVWGQVRIDGRDRFAPFSLEVAP